VVGAQSAVGSSGHSNVDPRNDEAAGQAGTETLESGGGDTSTVDVVGVGNAIVDVIGVSSDAFLDEQGLNKGAMHLIDHDRADELYRLMAASHSGDSDHPGDTNLVESSGGSAANTMAGIASFGGSASYIGKVSDDYLGGVFIDDMRSLGVEFDIKPAIVGPPTARCLILVTPDAQRTLSTYLGVSVMLEPGDVDADTVAAGRILFCEGYLWDVESAKQAIRKAMAVAGDAGRQVALTLSDPFCIERHHREFLELVAGPVDILFANEAELTRLYECELSEAVDRVATEVPLACVTLGARGSWLISHGERVRVAPEKVDPVVDTTGAGDQYAAGVLFGLSTGLSLVDSGRLGSLAAAEVISHVGPRPRRPLSEFLDQLQGPESDR
jgi:fructokinase